MLIFCSNEMNGRKENKKERKKIKEEMKKTYFGSLFLNKKSIINKIFQKSINYSILIKKFILLH